MPLRSFGERLCQSALFEIGGILLAAPLYALATGRDTQDGFVLITALALVVLLWSPLHNLVFDRIEWHRTRRRASDRPHGMRLIHALSHELCATVVTLPLIVGIGHHGFWQALTLDIGLSAFYVIYAYFYYLGYDLLRPIPEPLRFRTTRPQVACHGPAGRGTSPDAEMFGQL